tara:strand:- start:152 stop:673 length:522 start_codon:yes stop_codon:yes gene_type:complete
MNYSLNIKKFFTSTQPEENKTHSNISISKKSSSPKTILVLFPFEENFFRVASYSYRNLPYDRDNIEFHYLINRNFSDSFSLRRGNIHKMDLDDKLNIVNKNSLLVQLNKSNFDIIIDLNISYNQKMEDFILMQDSNYKIGFKHKKSDLLYNVQLDISKSQIAENGYQKILELI